MNKTSARRTLETVQPVMRPMIVEAPSHITALTPDLCDAWEDYVQTHPEGTFFHTLAWRDSVRDVFGHEDVYLLARQGLRIVGVLPLFLVESRIAGRMLVSVPYGVGGGVLSDNERIAVKLFEKSKELATRDSCRTIDLRSERAIIPGINPVDRYVGFRRELPAQVEDVLGWIPRKARAACRNARNKYGLEALFGDEHLAEVWRLYTISMRRLGSLNYPLSFFEQLVRNTPERHWITLVRWNGRTVAGLVTFLFKNTVLPYFIGTTGRAKQCSAANFIYLSVMERGVEAGYRVFDFGRSRRDNTGSYDFKRFSGFVPRPLGYQSYTPPGVKSVNLSPSNPRFRLARRVWSHLPLCVTRAAGALMAKHIPG